MLFWIIFLITIVAIGRIMQDNFWIGVFYYHVYDQFDFIQLPERSADDGFSKTCS